MRYGILKLHFVVFGRRFRLKCEHPGVKWQYGARGVSLRGAACEPSDMCTEDCREA